jgi:hypothetical protein
MGIKPSALSVIIVRGVKGKSFKYTGVESTAIPGIGSTRPLPEVEWWFNSISSNACCKASLTLGVILLFGLILNNRLSGIPISMLSKISAAKSLHFGGLWT